MHSPREVLRINPRPIDTMVTYFETSNIIVTTINREWADGDSGPEGRCRRCFTCVARRNKCQMSVGKEIPDDDAWDHSPKALGAEFEPR